MGRHSKQKVRPWAGAGRVVALTGAVGAGMIGLTASPLAGLAAAATPGATTAQAGDVTPAGDEAELIDSASLLQDECAAHARRSRVLAAEQQHTGAR